MGSAVMLQSGVGLPVFISKLDSGSFTPTEDTTGAIYHHLGEVPFGLVLYDTAYDGVAFPKPGDTIGTQSALIACFQLNGDRVYHYLAYPVLVCGTDTDGNVATRTKEYYTNYIQMDDTYFNVHNKSTEYKFKAGHTYNWFVWA